MPIYTTLEFFRTPQTIISFDEKYPKSIAGLHDAIKDSLSNIDNMIREVTANYLKGFDNHESFIRDKMISISMLLTETKKSGLYKRYDFEYVCDMAGSTRDLNFHINKVKTLCQDIINYNPNEFKSILDILEKIVSCMEKYLRSFYTGSIHDDPHRYMETAYKYEKQRHNIMKSIKENLHSMFNMANNFIYTGLKTEDFSDETIQLARKTKSTEVPGLLLFRENCFIIEDCKRILLEWIELDREYLKNIRTDIETVLKDKSNLEIKRRDDFDEYVRHRHRHEKQKYSFEKRLEKRSTIEKKILDCEVWENKLLKDVKYNEIELESLSIAKSKLLEDMESDGRTVERVVALTRLDSKKDGVRQRFRHNKTKIDYLELRMENYRKFLRQLELEKKSLETLKMEIVKLEKIVEKDEQHLNEINQNINELQAIASLKSANVTLKKIFHNLDLGNRMSFLTNANEDAHSNSCKDLTLAIKITSKMINKDWKKLYYNFQFHPPRGDKEIENDIARITADQVRGLLPDLALQSLNIWRRLHTRANLLSLTTALAAIERHDIIDKISANITEKLIIQPATSLLRHTHDDKPSPLSATTRFLYKHYPHLQPEVSKYEPTTNKSQQ